MTFKSKDARKGDPIPPLKGWEKGLSHNEKLWVEEWNRTDNKSAASRLIWPQHPNPANKAYQISRRIQVKRAMSMIRGRPWDGPERLVETEKQGEDRKDKGWKTRTARQHHRDLEEMKPLDCLLQSMHINWDEAEHAVDLSSGKRRETAESLAFRKEACVYAKEAAPYMHARLSNVTVRDVDEYEAMSDADLDKTILGLLKEVAGAKELVLESSGKKSGNGNGNGSKPGTPPVRH